MGEQEKKEPFPQLQLKSYQVNYCYKVKFHPGISDFTRKWIFLGSPLQGEHKDPFLMKMSHSWHSSPCSATSRAAGWQQLEPHSSFLQEQGCLQGTCSNLEIQAANFTGRGFYQTIGKNLPRATLTAPPVFEQPLQHPGTLWGIF